MNIDDEVGFVSLGTKGMAFGHRANNNSIMTAKAYLSYSATPRTLSKGTLTDRRNAIYYSHVDAQATRKLAQQGERLVAQLPSGWNGIIAADPDKTRYLMLAHFDGDTTEVTITARSSSLGAPVFENKTVINDGNATATFHAAKGTALMQTVKCFIQGNGITAQQVSGDDKAIWLQSDCRKTGTVTIIDDGTAYTRTVKLSPTRRTKVFMEKHRMKATTEKTRNQQ